MKINEKTKVIARFVPDANPRGLNIYNPFFQETNINAVYLLFPNTEPKILIESMRNLNFAGAIVAQKFEKDPQIAPLLDQLDPLAKKLGKIGTIVNKKGKLLGTHSAAYGLLESLNRLTNYSGKKIVILGAGTVVKGLLSLMELTNKKPRQFDIYNRTLSKAHSLTQEFTFINNVEHIADLTTKAEGDIFINATSIGSPWNKEPFDFPKSFIDRFQYIIDVTFVPLKTPLIRKAHELGKITSPGYEMFLFQGKRSLELILEEKINEKILLKHILKDFKKNLV